MCDDEMVSPLELLMQSTKPIVLRLFLTMFLGEQWQVSSVSTALKYRQRVFMGVYGFLVEADSRRMLPQRLLMLLQIRVQLSETDESLSQLVLPAT